MHDTVVEYSSQRWLGPHDPTDRLKRNLQQWHECRNHRPRHVEGSRALEGYSAELLLQMTGARVAV